MAHISPNAPRNPIQGGAEIQAQRPSGMLENHPDLTPVDKERVYVEDQMTRTELEGAINAASIKLVQEAMTDGKKNVVAIEANLQDGYVDVVNYEAQKTDDFVQGDSENVEGVVNITLPFVDDNPDDDAQQITLNPEVGRMLANDPRLEVGKARFFHADDFDTKAELTAAVNRAAIEVGQDAETDGYQNIVTVEANLKDGTIGVVSYRAQDVSDYTQGDELNAKGFLHLSVAYIDKNPKDDSGKFSLNLPPMQNK